MDKLTKKCVTAYQKHKHLKLAASEVGIPWQTLYVKLKKAGVAVTGDKQRYGSIEDKLANKAELIFHKAVPFARNNNDDEFQSTVDFNIGEITVDVKASTLKKAGRNEFGKKYSSKWGFCISKQKDIADFFVLYAFDHEGKNVKHIFVVPNEIAIAKTTVSIPGSLKSKWADYEVKENELFEFFQSISDVS